MVGRYRFSLMAKRQVSERVLFSRFAHRIARAGSIRKAVGQDGDKPPAG
jgi:hypothetical protein